MGRSFNPLNQFSRGEHEGSHHRAIFDEKEEEVIDEIAGKLEAGKQITKLIL